MLTSMLFDKLLSQKNPCECAKQLQLNFNSQYREKFDNFLMHYSVLGNFRVKGETNAWLHGNGKEYDALQL